MTTAKKLALLDIFIDTMCEVDSPRGTIKFILDSGYTKRDLLDLQFDEEDIDLVMEEK